MKMIEMLNIVLALPKCSLSKPDAGCQFIVDKNGKRVGHIHWNFNEVAVYTDYEHCETVIEQIEKETGKKFTTIDYPDADEECRKEVDQMRKDGLMPGKTDMEQAADDLYGH